MTRINIYIDGNNLYRAAKGLGFKIDYKKFGVWLRQKYKPQYAYIFIGFIEDRSEFYRHLEQCGFVLVFKETIAVEGMVKGNCDAELVLGVVSGFYKKSFDMAILVTGDGDFGCIVEFLKVNNALDRILSPDKRKCSTLLKNKFVEITFLNEHYAKFSITIPLRNKS